MLLKSGRTEESELLSPADTLSPASKHILNTNWCLNYLSAFINIYKATDILINEGHAIQASNPEKAEEDLQVIIWAFWLPFPKLDGTWLDDTQAVFAWLFLPNLALLHLPFLRIPTSPHLEQRQAGNPALECGAHIVEEQTFMYWCNN